MSEQEKKSEELDAAQLDAVAGGTPGVGTLFPGQTATPEPSDFAVVSGLGSQASSYTLKQPAVLDNPPGY